jgi:hypothetical protein
MRFDWLTTGNGLCAGRTKGMPETEEGNSTLTKLLFSRVAKIAMLPGIGGISQSVAGQLVARCADPSLTNAEFEALITEAKEKGYELSKA